MLLRIMTPASNVLLSDFVMLLRLKLLDKVGGNWLSSEKWPLRMMYQTDTVEAKLNQHYDSTRL